MIVRNSPVPLHLQIELELRERIESGALKPLTQLPSESGLAKEFQVSRMTARKAVDALVNEGMIFRRPGKGTFVAPAKIGHRFSTMVSFSAAMENLGLRHHTEVLEATTTLVEERIASELELPVEAPVVVIRRLRLVEGDPAALHTVYLPRRFAAILEDDLQGSLHSLMRRASAVVSETRDWVDAVAASSDVASLLDVKVGSPLVRVQGVGYSSAREPLRLTDALYRGDRFRFSVESSGANLLQVEYKN